MIDIGVSENYVFISSTSSFRAASTDFPDPLSPPVSIIHCSRRVLQATSSIGRELLCVGFSWSSSFARPCEWVHWSTSLMRSSFLLRQCSACLVRLIWIVFVMGGSCSFVECYLQDSFNMTRSILA